MEIELSKDSKQVDRVSLYIDEELKKLSPTCSGHCIYKVPNQLRKENEEAYEPKTIAIGPYHRDKNNLKAMEEHKFRYLQQFIQLQNESSVKRYITVMQDLEGRARKCYAESFNLDSDEFVQMMLLDGCFIIHLFRKHMFQQIRNRDPNDLIFHLDEPSGTIRHDLMLTENQLPFFILDQLVNMTKLSSPKDNIIDLTRHSLITLLPSIPNASKPSNAGTTDRVQHILGLVHEIWCFSFVEVLSQRRQGNQKESWEFIKCTTELQEAGVKFKKSSPTTISLLDIKFENGVMEIPPLSIEDNTEVLFRNLIAYEQCSRGPCIKYVTAYTNFMDCLINSPKDVEHLRHEGIIENLLGDDEAVSTMFNKLCHHVTLCTHNYYSEVYKNVNRHSGQRLNIWLANLRRKYFNSPWSIISSIAAALLLLFTLIQTVFSVLSYFRFSGSGAARVF